MRGRPKRHENTALIDALQKARLVADLSYTKLAQKLGVKVSTITRSIRAGGFSADLEIKIAALLDAGLDSRKKIGAESSPAPSASKNESLHLLQKFIIMVPEIESALRTVLQDYVANSEGKP